MGEYHLARFLKGDDRAEDTIPSFEKDQVHARGLALHLTWDNSLTLKNFVVRLRTSKTVNVALD